MVSPGLIQEAFITLLKSKQAVVAVVTSPKTGVEIREDNWNGEEFSYPNLRVSLLSMGPFSNGECRPQYSNIMATIICYAEGTSSKACSALAGLVANNLMGQLLRGPTIIPVTRINIPDNVGVTMPVPDGERLWRAEVQCITQIKEAN